MSFTEPPPINKLLGTLDDRTGVRSTIDDYLKFFDPADKQVAKSVTDEDLAQDAKITEERKKNYSAVVDAYYNISTDFYEYAWGEGLHFAVLRHGEGKEHSTAKHEYYLGMRLRLKPGENVLDVGCGVGAPTRHIAALSDAKIHGVTINQYQVERARYLTRKQKLEHLCTYEKADFHHLPYSDNYFDKAYAIEATVHSPNLCQAYSEVFRVLKPGGMFGIYEVLMTDKYDPRDPYHRKLKQMILIGDGLPDLVTITEGLAAARKAGFEVVESYDRALEPTGIPWHINLMARWTLSDLKMTPLGRWFTHIMLYILETLHLAPSGSYKVHQTLCKGADGLIAAGNLGLITPMYMMILRKPSN